MKPFVYIASAYTKGDPAINTHFQMRMFHEMMDDGIVWPYAPLLTNFQHIAFPRNYQDWIDYDLAIIPRMDACIRLTAVTPLIPTYEQYESSGADGEVGAFCEMGKPVFYSKRDLYSWAKGLTGAKP